MSIKAANGDTSVQGGQPGGGQQSQNQSPVVSMDIPAGTFWNNTICEFKLKLKSKSPVINGFRNSEEFFSCCNFSHFVSIFDVFQRKLDKISRG